MPALWNAWKDGEAASDADLAHRVTSAISEVTTQRHLHVSREQLWCACLHSAGHFASIALQ